MTVLEIYQCSSKERAGQIGTVAAAAGSVVGASSQATVVRCRLELGAGYGMETNDAGYEYDLSVSPPCVCTVARRPISPADSFLM